MVTVHRHHPNTVPMVTVAMVRKYRTHTVCAVVVWVQYTDTVPTLCVLLLCGYGTQMWCLDDMYSRHVATVHACRGHTVCTFAMWTWYTATVPPCCVWSDATDKETDCQRC